MQKHIDGIKITTLVIFILVTAAIFLALGYWAGSEGTVCNVSSIVSSKTATTTATTSVSPAASPSADVTANWKTYTNDTYGFSFKYPSDWSITNNTPGQNGSVNQNLTIVGSGSEKLQLWVNPDGFGFEGASDFYQAKIEGGKLVVTSKEKREPNSDFPELTPQVVIGTTSGNANTFSVSYSFAMADRNAELLKFDQILSTFQFTK